MKSQAKLATQNVLDTFTGADGGAGFVAFRALIEDMEKKRETGDTAAAEVIRVLLRFSALLDTARRIYSGDPK